ncbi:MAG: hypothetical protein L0Y50_04245, partial [Beijerinckiaceae bacterium]|nr:hypothetical protein [Beijerinckiaceae bacterium]
GPKLHNNIQLEIPSFRGTYQTSAFLATLLAIGDPGENWALPQTFSDYTSEQLLVSRIFEIDRHGDFLALAGDRRPLYVRSPQNPGRRHQDCPDSLESCNTDPLIASAGSIIEGRSSTDGRARKTVENRPCGTREDTTNCGDIQPAAAPLFPRFEMGSRHTLAAGLAALSVLVLIWLYVRLISRAASVEALLISLGLAAGALACFFWEPLAQLLTDNGNGEPLTLLQGVSIWPTVLLRGLGIILALYFVWRAQRSLRDNLADIAEELRLESPFAGTHAKRSLWKNILGGVGVLAKTGGAGETTPVKVDAVWREYTGQEGFWPRFWRALSYTAVMFLIVRFVVIPMFGNPIVPARGELAAAAYYWSTLLYGLLMLFLIFFVFDATCSCLRFVNKIRSAQSKWPAGTASYFSTRLRLQGDLVHDWIDLEFVARRTRCIGSLIYYPFVLIALLIVTRSTVFASFPPNPSSLIALAISLCVVFSCAIMLCWEAKAVRDTAKRNLMTAIIAANGHRATVPAGGQGGVRKDSGGSGHYAAQLESLLRQVDQMTEGAFSPFSQQPLVRAMLWPLGGAGWTVLIENGMLPGL